MPRTTGLSNVRLHLQPYALALLPPELHNHPMIRCFLLTAPSWSSAHILRVFARTQSRLYTGYEHGDARSI